jgi:hypothetical protein
VGKLMARLRDRTAAGWRYDPEGHEALDIILNLLLAPTGEYTEDQLRIAWEVERDRLMEHDRNNPATFATRPWAYRKFELGEEPPRDDREMIPFPWREAIRLAELGDLQPNEVAALAERAAESKTRIDKGPHYEHISAPGTDMERWSDRETVAAWEKVEKALKR